MMKNIVHNLYNIPGWHTKRHLVVIESDDWGAIRMPSLDAYNQFLKEGIRVDRDVYCRYDALATKEDLEDLFDALTSVKDKNGNNAVLTADSVVANPDFKKIKDSNFQMYHYEPFTKTLENSSRHSGVFDLWKEGIERNIFRPQFHGREHLNIKKWLDVLRKGEDQITRRAFDLGSFGLTSTVNPTIKGNYMGAFDSCLQEDIESYETIIKEGLDLFKRTFGYTSKSFIATTYTWSPSIESILYDNSVLYLQGLVSQHIPLDDGQNFSYKKNNYQGKQNSVGQYYLMRNCFFEPSHFRDCFDVIDECLHRINIAFRWGKAAVISSHRVNFIGNIDELNRDKNLLLFKELLNRIVQKWPDVEFVSSDRLGDIMSGKE